VKPFLWAAASGPAAFLCGVLPLLPGPGWLEGPSRFLLFFEPFVVFPWIAAVLFVPVAAAHAVFNRDEKRWWRRGLGVALILIVSVPLGVVGGEAVRRARFAAAAERAAPVVAGIEEHRRRTGRDPESVDTPYTGMMAYPSFRYERAQEGDRFGRYELSIDCPSGLINWDRFVYWPEGNYPGAMYGGGVERIGAWAYVHE
jgi:hypothetical protein